MTRTPQPISAPLLGGDAPSDAMRPPCCGDHVRRPFCLFGHVTPHGPIRDALDAARHHNHADLAVDLATEQKK